jgi:predicted transcriptional regulator with HTH domain
MVMLIQKNMEEPWNAFECDPKIIRSLMRSEIRTSVLIYLYRIYPQASYPAEIARCIDAHALSVIGGLKGIGNRYRGSSSLLALGVVHTIKLEDGAIFYKLSDVGAHIAEVLTKNTEINRK